MRSMVEEELERIWHFRLVDRDRVLVSYNNNRLFPVSLSLCSGCLYNNPRVRVNKTLLSHGQQTRNINNCMHNACNGLGPARARAM